MKGKSGGGFGIILLVMFAFGVDPTLGLFVLFVILASK
jgi:hypothetical protein